jgi:hypothetical protein
MFGVKNEEEEEEEKEEQKKKKNKNKNNNNNNNSGPWNQLRIRLKCPHHATWRALTPVRHTWHITGTTESS